MLCMLWRWRKNLQQAATESFTARALTGSKLCAALGHQMLRFARDKGFDVVNQLIGQKLHGLC